MLSNDNMIKEFKVEDKFELVPFNSPNWEEGIVGV